MEDKQKILNLLLPALQATRNLKDLTTLEYDSELGVVVAVFTDDNQKWVTVAGDSGTAMIQDVIRQLVWEVAGEY